MEWQFATIIENQANVGIQGFTVIMIVNIKEEVLRFESDHAAIQSADYFNDRKYQSPREWGVLGKVAGILEECGHRVPQYAEKLDGEGEPDFQTYISCVEPFRKVEVTEVHRPERKRGKEYMDRENLGRSMFWVPPPHSNSWQSFAAVLKKKLAKPYADDAWLFVYHNMWAFDFEDWSPWPERTLSELRKWKTDSEDSCDIGQSRYQSIFVLDSAMTSLLRLHPHWDVIKWVSPG